MTTMQIDIATLVTTWIRENGAGELAQYDIAPAAAMLQKWADEDANGIVTALPAEDVAAVIESHRARYAA